MIEKASGSIVNVCSIGANTVQARRGAYSPSKAAAVMLAREAAVEWGYRGIRANAVSPRIVRTPFAEPFITDEEDRARREAALATGRIGNPEDAAGIIAFLLSDTAWYITGDNIQVDGGLSQVVIEMLHPGNWP